MAACLCCRPTSRARAANGTVARPTRIYQNIGFIQQYDPDYVLILSGDHIYKMDYNAMLMDHIHNDADCTIAVREVPWEEASRFGIMNTDENNRIVEFEEKPPKPKSNKASMGVYIFTWKKLYQYLTEDEADPKSSNDFGKNIIPNMLRDGQRLFAYTFDGYWKDVGTIESLWEANMDLLRQPMPIDLYDKKWRVYARNPGMPPHYVAPGAKISGSLVTEGCEVFGEVAGSVLFAGVTVGAGAQGDRLGRHAARRHRARGDRAPRHRGGGRAHRSGLHRGRGDGQHRRGRPGREPRRGRRGQGGRADRRRPAAKGVRRRAHERRNGSHLYR